jgi:hypothetical protein
VSGFDPRFESALSAMFAAAPPELGLSVKSGYRTPERQGQLWQAALTKYGSPEAARKWVAPPGRSQHNHGMAADLGYASPAAVKWAHENAAKYGLAFPLGNENWHVELAGARGNQLPGAAPVVASAQPQAAGLPPAQDDGLDALAIAASGRPSLAQTFFAMQQAQQERQDADKKRREALFADPWA